MSDQTEAANRVLYLMQCSNLKLVKALQVIAEKGDEFSQKVARKVLNSRD